MPIGSYGGLELQPNTLAEQMAGGGAVQQLTASTPLINANHVFRIWKPGGSAVLKVYGSDARERREHHALNALEGVDHLPKILDRGEVSSMHWILFEDAGKWNLESLPENPGLAKVAGAILRDIHECDRSALSNLVRGIDHEWVAVDFRSSLRRLERYRGRVGVSSEYIQRARDVNPPYASEPTISHTDPTTRNFIVDNAGGVTLIDWEWATLAPPEWDLSRTAWSIGMHAGPTAASAVFVGYGRALDEIQLDRWIVYHSAQTLVRVAETNLSSGRASVPSVLVHEFHRAVLGAS
jgi:aminoglycoside phosphotransferase (APT) family kinase protein